jgi:hypothetical protein
MAAEDFLRSHPFAFKKDTTLGPASIASATSLAVHSDERGGGLCQDFVAPEHFKSLPLGIVIDAGEPSAKY